MTDGGPGDSTLTVRADPSLAPGGCLLRADDAVLDATVQTRIARSLAAVGIDGTQARSIADAAIRDAGAAADANPDAAS